MIVDREQNLHINTIIVHTKESQITRSIFGEELTPTIVMIHGYGGTGRQFRRFICIYMYILIYIYIYIILVLYIYMLTYI